jgi:hypothetical protein
LGSLNNNNNNKPESCLENDNYKLYFDRTVLTDIHIQHNRPDIVILDKQQSMYSGKIAVPPGGGGIRK